MSVGSIVATLVWIVASVCFSIYLANFGSYNEVYGSLGAVIALLMWFYLINAIVPMFFRQSRESIGLPFIFIKGIEFGDLRREP